MIRRLAVGLGFVAACMLAWPWIGSSSRSAPFVPRLEPRVTHITAPLTKEGTVDYLAESNTRRSTGVTADNNWEVVVRRVLGPVRWNEPNDDEYYRRLGIEKPAANTAASALRRALDGDLPGKPWHDEEFPELAAWLDGHVRQLDELTASSFRTRYYVPFVVFEPDEWEQTREFASFHDRLRRGDASQRLIAFIDALPHGCSFLPSPLSRSHYGAPKSTHQDLELAFRSRALRRIGAGELEAARQDLLTLHRIARLHCQGAGVEWILGADLERLALRVAAQLLDSERLTPEVCRRHLDDLAALPPLRPVAEVLDNDERHKHLDSLQHAARQWRTWPQQMLRTAPNFGAVDRNLVMLTVNAEFDRVVQFARQPSLASRTALAAEFRERGDVRSEKEPKSSFATPPRRRAELSRWLGQRYFDRLGMHLANVEAMERMRMAATRAAFAACLFRWERGVDPMSVNDLRQFLKDMPLDEFSGQPLILRATEAGIVVYSVGIDFVDNAGDGFRDVRCIAPTRRLP